MKQFFSTIIILSILSFQFSDFLVYVSFKINQDYIAKNLCVEKDVEGSDCKGCCQLKKKLEEQQAHKEQVPPAQNGKQDVDLFTGKNFIFHWFPPQSKMFSYFLSGQNSIAKIISVFHPPRIL